MSDLIDSYGPECFNCEHKNQKRDFNNVMDGMQEVYKEEHKKQQEQEKPLWDYILKVKGEHFVKKLKEYCENNDINNLIEFVKKPVGTRQEIEEGEEYPFKTEWVDEHVHGGYSGDDYEGDIYIYICRNHYLKMYYSM